MDSIRSAILERVNIPEDFEEIPYLEIFNAYDELRFYNQIRDKIEIDKTQLTFDGSIESEIPPNRCCNIIYRKRHHKITHIDFHFSNWVIGRLKYSNEKERLAIFGVISPKMSLLKLFEHELSHVIGILWGHSQSDISGKNPYGCHDIIYRCSTRIFFEDGISNIMDELSVPVNLKSSLSLQTPYVYWSNSCNIDSLTTMILASKASVFREAIFTTNPMTLSSTNFSVSCRKNNRIETIEDWRDFVDRFSSILISDYHSMTSKDINDVMCTDLRSTVVECLTDMKKGKSWKFYNVAEIYDLYTDMFPRLKIHSIPYISINNKTGVTSEITNIDNPASSFTFWDFMHDITTEEVDPETTAFRNIDWEKINSPFLVFKNEGLNIQKLGSIESEVIYDEEEIILTKNRHFDETILNGRYEMIGAVILEGVSPGEEGGVHYHSCIKTYEGWVYYDDVGPKYKKLPKFPKIILTEVKGRKPEMYFYQRVKI
jgi:hypothetical protein